MRTRAAENALKINGHQMPGRDAAAGITHNPNAQPKAKNTPMERMRHPSRHDVTEIETERHNDDQCSRHHTGDIPAADPQRSAGSLSLQTPDPPGDHGD